METLGVLQFSLVAEFPLVVTYVLAAIVGLCVGSFLNVVIYRVPEHMSIAHPASHCPKCKEPIRWYDNIPVLSFCILGGKCRHCKEPISPRYTIVEIANALLWVGCVWMLHTNIILMVLGFVACSTCICIFFIDLEHMIIPDRFQVILAVCAALATAMDIIATGDWLSHVIGLAAAAVLFFGVAFFMGKSMKREVLGGGDIKFALISGLYFGWAQFLFMVLAASLAASVGMVIQSRDELRRGENTKEIAFAPYLTAAFVITLLFGSVIVAWYINFTLIP